MPGTDAERQARLRERWRDVIEATKGQGKGKYRLDSLLRSAQLDSIQGDAAILGFTHKNFVDMMNGELENPGTRKALEDALERVAGKRYQVRCVLTERSPRQAGVPGPARGHLVRAAMDEMGAKPIEAGGPNDE
jgi:hypothetical protein